MLAWDNNALSELTSINMQQDWSRILTFGMIWGIHIFKKTRSAYIDDSNFQLVYSSMNNLQILK